MFVCVYEYPDGSGEGYTKTTNDIGECVAEDPNTGAVLVDISEGLNTTVEVTTAAPLSGGMILAGLGLMLLLGSKLGKKKGRR